MVKEATVLRDFQNVSYKKMVNNISDVFKLSGKTYVDLAYELEVKSISTAQNVFNEESQVVSDQILTKTFNLLGVEGMVVWVNGIRNYYIKY